MHLCFCVLKFEFVEKVSEIAPNKMYNTSAYCQEFFKPISTYANFNKRRV